MTIGDYPEYLALGFLRNQGMLRDADDLLGVDYDEELETAVVRTSSKHDLSKRQAAPRKPAPVDVRWARSLAI